ncbi:MFS general substrate transporter [Cylindrobasidium torrendii FP15055 ss-10]|uniref:MFS general substrate transporter n=1 Tax=Cylindrobasidium torrendii FP15055 ss-10 TaxID=1314674 RepID=A0A0D7AW75_9AGAR|nr:MFS general substrate transporter [Cylindrobasidium torrendii FP15055 ss-10]
MSDSAQLDKASLDIESKMPTVDDEAISPVDDFPDGGLRAWQCVALLQRKPERPASLQDQTLGRGQYPSQETQAHIIPFNRFGFVNSWGVFQAYYQTELLKDTPTSDIAWIGSIQYSFVFLPGVFAGRLFDLGCFRPLFLTSSALLVTATFLVAECKEYWHFLLCQGFAVGLAGGGIMSNTSAVVAHWFKKRRGLAMGIMAVGSSLGGTLIPIAARNLIPRIGFPWTMRIVGFVLLTGLTAANLLVRRRLPCTDVRGGLFNLAAFKNPAFTLYCASTFVLFFGIYTVLTYIDVSATSVGIPAEFSFYLVSIANAGSGVGRYCAGLLCDMYGPMNVMIPFTTIAAVMTFAWPYATTKGALIVVAIFYGFASGSFVSLLSNPVIEFGETADVGRRTGMVTTILSFGALAGPPISGAINTGTGGFEAVGWYAGGVVLVGVSLMFASRYLVLGGLHGRV